MVKLGYRRLGKLDKGLVKRYLGKVTGLSRAHLTRLIARNRKTGRVEGRRGGSPKGRWDRRSAYGLPAPVRSMFTADRC